MKFRLIFHVQSTAAAQPNYASDNLRSFEIHILNKKSSNRGTVRNLHIESEKGSRMEGLAREEVNIFVKKEKEEKKKLPTLHSKHSVKEEDERARWNAATVVYKSACRTARKKKFYKHKR